MSGFNEDLLHYFMLRAFYKISRGRQTQQKFPDIQYSNFIQEIKFVIKIQFIYSFIVQNKVENGYVDKEELDRVRREMEAHYRLELNRKLEDVNNYLEEQSRARERLDNSRDETEYKLKDDKKKIQVGGPELSDCQIPDIAPVRKLQYNGVVNNWSRQHYFAPVEPFKQDGGICN